MACATDHAAVAKLAAVRVLDCFPKAATEVALRALCWSLRAALAQCDWEEVERVVGERLDQGGLTAAERVCWVVAGYVIKPRRYREDCRSLKTDDDGLRWLTEFLSVRKLRLGSTRHFSPKDVVLFVGAAGAAYRKHGLSADAHWSIADAITALSKNPSMAASEALDILIEERDAEPWIPAITSAVDLQARSRREKEFEHCDIGQVVRTLDAGSPANSGDLAALVFDQLSEISEKTRGGSTTDWRQHWNVDKYNRPERPKPEDACRDALLSDMQDRLERLGVDAQPEGEYADDTRADIRVYCSGFSVPVEIKRSCHEDLWTAMAEQLITHYTRSRGAEGYGIYLVFWFGNIDACEPTKCSGWTPKTAEDVRRKLQDLVPEHKKSLISICVVDVSAPPHKQKGITDRRRAVR